MTMQRAAVLTACLGLAAATVAQPAINGAHPNTRVYDNFPASTLVVTNSYPALVQFSDSNLVGAGFANRHNFRLSSDGGATNAQFQNSHSFSFFSDLKLSGTSGASGEIGLQISPWWDPNGDGVLFMNGATGEVAAFGGRLPFYSFTGSQGASYTLGTTVRVGVEYAAHSNTAGDPGQIRYWYGALNSGWINFDQGNPGEDPPHGLYGILSPAYVGGYMQAPGAQVGTGTLVASFSNNTYVPTPSSMALLGLAGVVAGRRRRAV